MTGRSLSNVKRAQQDREEQDRVTCRAIEEYKMELGRGPGQKKRGLRKVCKDVSEQYFQETGRTVKLDPTTLGRLSKGGKSLSDFNAAKGWLLPAEADVVIDFVIEAAARGFPLSHRRLKAPVDEICKARLGDAFPESGVGRRWTDRFVRKHSDRLSTYWSRPLDSARGRAVNPHTKTAYFNLLKKTISDNHVEQELTYGQDESGFQPGGGGRERVIGGRGRKVQYQQRDGNRENITVMVTICADGTALPPAVIFKGESFQTSWRQDNPANAS